MKIFKMFAVVSFGLLSVGYSPAADKCPSNDEIVKGLESLKAGTINTSKGNFVFSQDHTKDFNKKRLKDKEALSSFLPKEAERYNSRKLESKGNDCVYSLTYTLKEKKSVLPNAIKKGGPGGANAVIVLTKE